MRTEIALLQNVRVASPCHASWEDMRPIDHDRVRFCDGCQKRVYNLSAMGQAEAEGLLRGHEGHLCVRYYRRHDGTILTSDCPVGLRAARQLILTRTRVSIGLCALLCIALAAHHATTRTTMGDRGALSTATPTPVIGEMPMSPVVVPDVKTTPSASDFEGGKFSVRMGRVIPVLAKPTDRDVNLGEIEPVQTASPSLHGVQDKRKHTR